MASVMDDIITPKAINRARALAAFATAKAPFLADEFESAALFALVESAAKFDPGLGNTFTTFAERRIWGAIQDVWRRERPKGCRRKREAPSVVSMDELSECDRPYRDLLASDELPVGWEIESEDEVRRILGPTRKGRLLARMYLEADRVTLKLAARADGISESRASQIRTEAFEEIKRGQAIRERGTERERA